MSETFSEPKPTRRKRVTREVWLDRIADHMLTNGASNVSVRELAIRFGVSAQALLNHFHTRENMVQEVLTRTVYRDVLRLEGMTGKMRSMDGLLADLLREFRRASFRRMFAVQVELFATAALQPKQYSNFAVRSTKIVHKQFEKQARRDGVPEDRVQAVSGMVVATLRGLVMEALGGRQIAQLEVVANQLRDWYATQLPAPGRKGRTARAA